MRLTMRGRLVVVAIALGIVAGVGACSHNRIVQDMPPCVTEDAPGPCYWDADTRGNGVGLSFVVWPDGTVSYR